MQHSGKVTHTHSEVRDLGKSGEYPVLAGVDSMIRHQLSFELRHDPGGHIDESPPRSHLLVIEPISHLNIVSGLQLMVAAATIPGSSRDHEQ